VQVHVITLLARRWAQQHVKGQPLKPPAVAWATAATSTEEH